MTTTVTTSAPSAPNALRDLLTGAPLAPDLPETRVRRVSVDRLDHQPRRADYLAGDRADLTPRPLRLHTQQVEHGGDAGQGLGGHAYSRQFAQYLASVRPLVIEAADREVRFWWASEYGQLRVRRRLVERMGANRGVIAYRAALLVASGYLACDDVMRETNHSAGWVYHLLRLAEASAFGRTTH